MTSRDDVGMTVLSAAVHSSSCATAFCSVALWQLSEILVRPTTIAAAAGKRLAKGAVADQLRRSSEAFPDLGVNPVRAAHSWLILENAAVVQWEQPSACIAIAQLTIAVVLIAHQHHIFSIIPLMFGFSLSSTICYS